MPRSTSGKRTAVMEQNRTRSREKRAISRDLEKKSAERRTPSVHGDGDAAAAKPHLLDPRLTPETTKEEDETPSALRKRSSSRKKKHTVQVGGVKVHVHMPTPWRKRASKSQPAPPMLPAGACSGGKSTPGPGISPGVSPTMSDCPASSPFGLRTGAFAAPTPRLGSLVRDVVQWRTNGDNEVALLQARIDDMWLDEVMLGCDTELFGAVRQAAADVEAGLALPEDAVRRAAKATEDAEAMALHSVRVRMEARASVHLQGGMAALEQKVRRRRREAADAVRCYVDRLMDPGRAGEVVRIMDRLLREAQEEYSSVNAMKTAKSEVVLELQDKASQRDWLTRQLVLALTQIEASALFAGDAQPRDAEHFFVETVRNCPVNDPLRERALRCLEHLRLWGSAASRALAALRPEDVEDTDSGTAGLLESAASAAVAGGAPRDGCVQPFSARLAAVASPELESAAPAMLAAAAGPPLAAAPAAPSAVNLARRLAMDYVDDEDETESAARPAEGSPLAGLQSDLISVAGLESESEEEDEDDVGAGELSQVLAAEPVLRAAPMWEPAAAAAAPASAPARAETPLLAPMQEAVEAISPANVDGLDLQSEDGEEGEDSDESTSDDEGELAQEPSAVVVARPVGPAEAAASPEAVDAGSGVQPAGDSAPSGAREAAGDREDS